MPCKRQMKVVVTWSSLMWQLTFIIFHQRINSAAWDPLTNLLDHTTIALVFLRREIAVKHCILLHLFSRQNFGSRRIFGWNYGSTDSKKMAKRCKKVMLSMASLDFLQIPCLLPEHPGTPKNHGLFTLHTANAMQPTLAHKSWGFTGMLETHSQKNWRCAQVP